MALQITPKGEKDISKGFQNLPAGEYPFTVMESGINLSKSAANTGRAMCAVKLNIHGPDFDKHVYDYFADWFSEWKLKHFCEVVGLASDYVNGLVAPDNNGWQGRTGFVKVKIAPAKGDFEARNEVVDYLPEDNQTAEALNRVPKPPQARAAKTHGQTKANPAAPSEPESDDVPF